MIMEHERYEQRIQTVCLFILSVVEVTVALYWLKPVLIPVQMPCRYPEFSV